jgi:hypothetical protein
VPNLFVPGHVVSELRGVRFSGFPFEWDMAYNNLPCTTVQAVINMMLQTANYFTQNALKLAYEHLEHEKFFQGASPPGPPRKREEGRGRGRDQTQNLAAGPSN